VMLERRTPLRRGTKGLKRTELKRGTKQLGRGSPPKRSSIKQHTPNPTRAARDQEWSAYSTDVLRRRPRCEAGPVIATAVDVVCRCAGQANQVHHKWPHGSGGPYVPSEGLTDEMVCPMCDWCHTFTHGSGHPVVRTAANDGLLRRAPDA
jgi:hypothetical protein